MSSILLNVTRRKSFVGCAMPFRIIVDGVEMEKIMNGQTKTVTIPNNASMLKVSLVGNSMAIHEIKEIIKLSPEQCRAGRINCEIKVKANWLGILTGGLIFPVGDLRLSVSYE